jgi:hypothetical protein
MYSRNEVFGRGSTNVGVERAGQLPALKSLTADVLISMYSYLARDKTDKGGKAPQWASDAKPSAGYIAWML